jgi:hypothetical protein
MSDADHRDLTSREWTVFQGKPQGAGEGTRLTRIDSDGLMWPVRQPGESEEQWQAALAAAREQHEKARASCLENVHTPDELFRYCQTL